MGLVLELRVMTCPRSQAAMAKLRTLPAILKDEIRGQDHLIPSIRSVVERGELVLSDPTRPRGSFLLLGPTGVGKTETVIVTARHLGSCLFRFDMSEFQTQESCALLLGSKAGERGFLGTITDKTEEGTILFDEIEKAHPRVLDLLLQLLDGAHVTIATGEKLCFRKFYFWMTSNVGGPGITSLQHCTDTSAERHVLAQAEQLLRPELFARITEKLVFQKLGFDHQLEVAQKFLHQTLEFLGQAGHSLRVDITVLPLLVRKGFHPKLGARPMRDAVQKLVGDAVARAVLDGQSGSGLLHADVAGERLILC